MILICSSTGSSSAHLVSWNKLNSVISSSSPLPHLLNHSWKLKFFLFSRLTSPPDPVSDPLIVISTIMTCTVAKITVSCCFWQHLCPSELRVTGHLFTPRFIISPWLFAPHRRPLLFMQLPLWGVYCGRTTWIQSQSSHCVYSVNSVHTVCTTIYEHCVYCLCDL